MKKISLSVLLLLFITMSSLVHAQSTQTNRVTVTIAGNGLPGYNGDGNAGVSNEVTNPYDICMDAANNFYFTDMLNGRVRKVWAKNGMVTTIAGGGTSTADGIPGPQASIMPRNICLDHAGNIYIADSLSHKIRKIDGSTNIITTIAGTGVAGFGGDGGPATAAGLNDVLGICSDSYNNIYLVDYGNNCIRKVNAATGIISTIAGSITGTRGYTGDGGPATAALLCTPTAICIDRANNIFFADQTYGYISHIRKITAATGIISNVSGTGTIGGTLYGLLAADAWLGDVTGLCMSSSGDLFCNEISCSCRKIDSTTDSVSLVAGDFYTESFADCQPSAVAYMDDPFGLCADAKGNVYIADNLNNRIRKVIQLTHTPTFAYGEGQLVNICTAGTTVAIDSQFAITDIDSLQPETWTVLTAPASGTLSGFPYTTTSIGTGGIALTSGATYTPSTGFTGTDSFRVQVSDGTYSDVVTIYVAVGGPGGSVSATPSLCGTATEYATENVPGGTWSLSNSDASILPSGLMTGVMPGVDTITYSINNSCGTASATEEITITDCTSLGISNATEAQVLSVFPNPATSVLNIKWANWEAQNTIIISDITGREMLRSNVATNNAQTGTQQIDVTTLPAGIYLVKINGSGVKKFVKD